MFDVLGWFLWWLLRRWHGAGVNITDEMLDLREVFAEGARRCGLPE